jgi:hypothetical protein
MADTTNLTLDKWKYLLNYLYKFAGEAGDDTYHEGFAVFTDAKHAEIQKYIAEYSGDEFVEFQFGQGSMFCEPATQLFGRFKVVEISDDDAASLVRIFGIVVDLTDYGTGDYGSFPDPLEIGNEDY